MADVTRMLGQLEAGDPLAAEQILPLVYDELRKLAAARLAEENPGQTLQATALVHEAYVRLVGPISNRSDGSGAPVQEQPRWANRAHFFAAAAESMRRILIDAARRRMAEKRGGRRRRTLLLDEVAAAPETSDDLLALDEALGKLAVADPQVAELVKLRYFAGLTIREAAECLGISSRTADNYWAYAKAWLLREIEGSD